MLFPEKNPTVNSLKIVILAGVFCCVLFLVAVGVFLHVRGKYPNPETDALVTKAAWPITEALEAYKSSHGVYPTRLTELVPVHIPTIPAAPFGTRSWEYHRHDLGNEASPPGCDYGLWIRRYTDGYEGYYFGPRGYYGYDQ